MREKCKARVQDEGSLSLGSDRCAGDAVYIDSINIIINNISTVYSLYIMHSCIYQRRGTVLHLLHLLHCLIFICLFGARSQRHQFKQRCPDFPDSSSTTSVSIMRSCQASRETWSTVWPGLPLGPLLCQTYLGSKVICLILVMLEQIYRQAPLYYIQGWGHNGELEFAWLCSAPTNFK